MRGLASGVELMVSEVLDKQVFGRGLPIYLYNPKHFKIQSTTINTILVYSIVLQHTFILSILKGEFMNMVHWALMQSEGDYSSVKSPKKS